ncbi:unnamed protein product [Vitrella brassicaformis CCMP3155]|uniref:Uncharacterized protein n=2 Tax=Vitrella brassicaformis TaxID=1169539 RepID=A0A0G4G8J4_VITBC|nr:unnamed protein product [Vitrella brassicaformis CCMP3155]|eukprot:CEM24942.1 unnamed protein product [Vitrella brassicaformis CCMP3155]
MGNAYVVPRKTTDEASPSVHGQCLDFIHRDDRYQLYDEAKDIGRLRTAARFVGNDHFPAQTLRSRLNWSLHRIRLADGTLLDTVIAFDPQSVTEARLLLAAMWMVEQQRWDEVAEVLRWASQCGCCTLPVNLTAAGINKHADKTAYVSLPRVLAQLMVAGRHVDFGDGSRLELFRHGHQVRAINNQPGYRLTLDPHLPPGHLYPQHRLQDDPPVHTRIDYSKVHGRWGLFVNSTDASVSSCAKRLIVDHFEGTHQTNSTTKFLDRYVGGGRLDALLTESPHTPVDGCGTAFSYQDGRLRKLVLTKSTHNFVAWIYIIELSGNDVGVAVHTTEAAASGVGGAFRDRFLDTTALARLAVGAGVARYVFDGQQPPQQSRPQPQPPQPQQQGGDDSDDDDEDGGDQGDDYDDDDDGDVDEGDDDDIDPNDGQDGNGGSDEYSE